jgi:hypothetical protein
VPLIAHKDDGFKIILRLEQLLRAEGLKLLPFNLPLPNLSGNFLQAPYTDTHIAIKLPKLVIPNHKVFTITYLLFIRGWCVLLSASALLCCERQQSKGVHSRRTF